MNAGPGGFETLSCWNIPGLLRAAVRSPFYRVERRQRVRMLPVLGGASLAGLVFLVVGAIGGFCCMWVPLLAMILSVPATLLPAFMVSEGLLNEIELDTIEGLLLTTAGRAEVLWAKLAARLRGWVLVVVTSVAAFTVMGAIVGGMVGQDADDRLVAGVSIGLAGGIAVGVLVGLLLAGQSLTGATLATVAALQCQRRVSSYAMVSVIVAGITLVEGVAWGLVGFVVLMMTMARMQPGEEDIALLVVAGFLGLGVLVALRVLVVNWLMPALLMRYAARNMDRLLLVGR